MDGRVPVYERDFVCDLSGRQAAMTAAVAIDDEGGAYAELYDQAVPTVWMYSTERKCFADAWHIVNWVAQIKYLHEQTFDEVVRLCSGGKLEIKDVCRVALDFGRHPDYFLVDIRQHSKTWPEPAVLRDVLWRMPESVRDEVGTQLVEQRRIDEWEKIKLLRAPEIVMPSLPSAVVTPQCPSRFAALRRFFRQP